MSDAAAAGEGHAADERAAGSDETAAGEGPRREWISRCYDPMHRPDTCSVEANDGEIEILGPDGSAFILAGRDIVDFRASLDAATRRAAADVHQQQAGT